MVVIAIKPAALHWASGACWYWKICEMRFQNPGKNPAFSWFMIAVKTSKFSPRRVNKHHSAGPDMRALMCTDPTSLFDTLLRFSSPSFCALGPCTSMAYVAFCTLVTDPKTQKITRTSPLTNTTIRQHLVNRFFLLLFPWSLTYFTKQDSWTHFSIHQSGKRNYHNWAWHKT